MKKTHYATLKFAFTLFTILFISISCEDATELEIPMEHSLKHEKITLNEFKSSTKKEIYQSIQPKLDISVSNGITAKGTTETYTFAVQKTSFEDTAFQNFMIQKTNETYQYYLFHYEGNKKPSEMNTSDIKYTQLNKK